MSETTAVLEDRTQWIGSSDIAAILGISRWKTPLAVWAEKTGQIPPNEGPKPLRLRLGTRLEEVVAELFMDETGKKLQRANERRVHPKYPHFRAQIDRLVVNEDAVWEGKTTSIFQKKEWVDDEIPQEYIAQVMWALAITGRKMGYIAVLIGNEEFKYKQIERDPVLIAEMLKRADSFWNDFIVPKVMPGHVSAADRDTLNALFPTAEPQSQIELGDQAAIIVENRNAVIQDIKDLERRVDLFENELRVMLKEKECGRAGKWKVTWKNQKRKAYTVAACEYRKLDIREIKGETA